MRITGIEIKNFRAFYGSYQINLYKSGKNLLIYGALVHETRAAVLASCVCSLGFLG